MRYESKPHIFLNLIILLFNPIVYFRYCQQPIIPKCLNKVPIAAYDYAQEVNDINALDELVMDPDEMRMQALVIRERILGPTHPDTSYYIRYR